MFSDSESNYIKTRKLEEFHFAKINNINHFGLIEPNTHVPIDGLKIVKCHKIYSRHQQNLIFIKSEDINNIPVGWVEVKEPNNKIWWANPKEVSYYIIRNDDFVEVYYGYHCFVVSYDEYKKLI